MTIIESVDTTTETTATTEATGTETLKRKAVDAVAVPLEANEVDGDESKRVKVAAAAAETSAEDEALDAEDEAEDALSETFFAWLVTGSSAGAFLAAHREKSVADALPAVSVLIENKVEQIYEDEEDESEVSEKDNTEASEKVADAKDKVNFAIEDAYAIILQDATDTDSPASTTLRELISASSTSKTWLKIRVSREEPEDKEAGRVPITVSVFDVRNGLIIPKIACWKYLVEAECASADVDKGVKEMMERFC
ncbi:hypothetical protein HDU98_007951 [Podochytrium sp. JEL0797]|nr:hypothetical protein HDU98_007951 [Podochytrium sp. JEL0797]